MKSKKKMKEEKCIQYICITQLQFKFKIFEYFAWSVCIGYAYSLNSKTEMVTLNTYELDISHWLI